LYAAFFIILVGLAIFYTLYQPSPSELTGQYLEVTVPKGQRSQLLLPDGTKVWLNSGSIFKYPVNFLKQGRNVYVEGEAFFSVTHKKNNLPFVVHLKEALSIRVLGTEFNVKSYAEDKVIETTLVKGQIRLIKEDAGNKIISELNIKPNEKATYQKRNKQIIITYLISGKEDKIQNILPVNTAAIKAEDKEVDDLETITSWKNEELVFQDETFEDIGVKMERWFGLKITITDENLKKERFTGKFANKETIYQILDIFNRSEPIQYNSKNKEIIISKKSKKP
jgi:ferric-dicitrate binding protein FerR (iron transport regulator)